MGLFSSEKIELRPELKDLTDKDFELFRKLIYEQSGISLNKTKKELLRTRLRARLTREGYKSYRDYYNFVSSDKSGEALIPLLDDISTNLTSFFREMNHFNFLNSVLPEWIERKGKARDTAFRVWSAGCSTGEEPYSIMFTLLAHLHTNMPPWDIKYLATDISTEVLKKAYLGIYPKEKTDGVPPDYFKAYFQKGEPVKNREMVRVRPDVRKYLTFKRFNLMNHLFPFKYQFDFIFCRNVMIYFDRPTQEVLVAKFHRHLKPGGYLFIGHSESLTGLKNDFKYIQPTIYQK